MMMGMKTMQFGLPINDIFGAVVILETAFTAANVISDISLQIDLAAMRPNVTEITLENVEIQCGIIAVICLVKFVLFIGLVWIGFICQRKPILLKVWIILGVLLDLTLQSLWLTVLLVYYSEMDIETWEYVYLICVVIIFRSYIYIISFTAFQELSDGSDFRGFGQGLFYLFHYYKNEFQRVASILLVVEIMWNSRTALEGDLPNELGMDLVGLEGNVSHFYSAAFPFRVIRIILALVAFYCVTIDKKLCLKCCWGPFFSVSIGLSIFYWFVVMEETEVSFRFFALIFLFIISFSYRGILIYYIIRFVFRKPNAPIPLESVSDPNSNDR